MKITVHVKTNSRINSVESTGDTSYTVRTKAKPHDGKANAAVLKLLSIHFDIPLSSLTIRTGHTNRNKIIEIV